MLAVGTLKAITSAVAVPTVALFADTSFRYQASGELPDVYVMAALSFGVAFLAGALRQLDAFSEHNGDSPNASGACAACVFSGIAGFITYTFSREYIDDPLKLIVEAILAGLVGTELVKNKAREWGEKFAPSKDKDKKDA